MEAIRQTVKVKNHKINITLPDDFNAEEVDVIILPSSAKYEIPQWQIDEVRERTEKYLKNPENATDIDENVDSKLAERFHLSFKESLAIIKKYPFHFQIRHGEVRIIMLTTFPYLIHFTVYKNVVVIKAIYHSSRDSKLNIL